MVENGGVFTWLALPRRWKVQVAGSLILPLEDSVVNKFRIWEERHFLIRKPYQLTGWTKDSSYYSAPVWEPNSRPPASIASSWPSCLTPLTTQPWRRLYYDLD